MSNFIEIIASDSYIITSENQGKYILNLGNVIYIRRWEHDDTITEIVTTKGNIYSFEDYEQIMDKIRYNKSL